MLPQGIYRCSVLPKVRVTARFYAKTLSQIPSTPSTHIVGSTNNCLYSDAGRDNLSNNVNLFRLNWKLRNFLNLDLWIMQYCRDPVRTGMLKYKTCNSVCKCYWSPTICPRQTLKICFLIFSSRKQYFSRSCAFKHFETSNHKRYKK